MSQNWEIQNSAEDRAQEEDTKTIMERMGEIKKSADELAALVDDRPFGDVLKDMAINHTEFMKKLYGNSDF